MGDPVECRNAVHAEVVAMLARGCLPTCGGCLLRQDDPARCGYFERALLPAAPVAVQEEYLATFGVIDDLAERLDLDTGGEASLYPDCGKRLRKGKRYCPDCRARRRRDSNRCRRKPGQDGSARNAG